MWWVDDRCKVLHAKHAEVGHRGRTTLIFIRLELAITRTLGKVLHLIGDSGQRFGFRLTHNWRNQTARDGDSNADIRTLVLDHAAFSP
ncbi:hypothetical protein D3C80_471590 [compost metagenome]